MTLKIVRMMIPAADDYIDMGSDYFRPPSVSEESDIPWIVRDLFRVVEGAAYLRYVLSLYGGRCLIVKFGNLYQVEKNYDDILVARVRRTSGEDAYGTQFFLKISLKDFERFEHDGLDEAVENGLKALRLDLVPALSSSQVVHLDCFLPSGLRRTTDPDGMAWESYIRRRPVGTLRFCEDYETAAREIEEDEEFLADSDLADLV